MSEVVEQLECLCHDYNASLHHKTPPQTRKERKKWSHVQRYNEEKRVLAETSIEESSTDSKDNGDLPTVFRIMEDEVKDPDSFYINASIAERKPQFRMIIHPDAMENHKDLHYRQYYRATPQSRTLDASKDNAIVDDEEILDFKPSLTRCQVLWRGYYCKDSDSRKTPIPVTKMLLQPLTGRRHQLRLHMVVLGHPILGDFTYQYHPPPNLHGMEEERTVVSTVNYDRRSLTRRMCLHAHMLTLPLLKARNSDASQFINKEVMLDSTFIAPDPFQCIRSEKENTDSLLIEDHNQW
jgi:hypothetical protein